MPATFENHAEGNARVGAMIGQSIGPVGVSISGEEANDAARQLLIDQIAALRREIAAAVERAELSADSSLIAQYELDTATGEVDAAMNGDRTGLLASLNRLKKPLAGAIGLVAEVAEIITAVKGLR